MKVKGALLKAKAVIVDLDGTLCDVNHRIHLLKQENSHRSDFFKKMKFDSPYEWCRNLVHILLPHYELLFLTGRPNIYREQTTDWLFQHVDLDTSRYELFMRPTDDHRLDAEFKKEVFHRHIQNQFQVEFVIEDRESVVQMWRNLGLTCLQCQDGRY